MNNNGLSSANFLGGAMQGYQFMQGVEDNKQRNVERKQIAGLREADESRRAEQFQMQQTEHQQNQQFHSARMRQVSQAEQEKAEAMLARQLYAIDSGTDLSPEEKENFVRATGGARALDPQYLSSPDLGEALEIYPQIMNGAISPSDPRAIKAANTLFNVQRGAKDGRQVSINRIVPSRDGQGIHFGLHVKNADGTENPNAVLTDNRSSEPNDSVSTISLDEVNEIYGATKNLRDMAVNPKYRQMLYRKHGLGEQSVSAKDQSTIDYNKARANYYNGKAESEKGGTGAGGKLPADAQMINFYRDMGYSNEDSIAMTNNAVSSPEKFATTYSKMILESSKDFDGKPTITPEQAIRQSLKIYHENFKPRTANGEVDKQEREPESSIVNDLMRGAQPSPQTEIPLRVQTQAPSAAIEYLKSNPDQAENFKAKYGYLPN